VLRAVELFTVVLGRVVPAASGGSAAAEEGAAVGLPAAEEVMAAADFPGAEVTAAAAAQAAAGDINRDSA
jgi:hypothetical protein